MAVYDLYDLKDYFQRIAIGDEKAFATVFDLFKKKVFAVAFKMLKSETEAEEIIQEVFLSLWRARGRISDVENPEGYIFQKYCKKPPCTGYEIYPYFFKQTYHNFLFIGNCFLVVCLNSPHIFLIISKEKEIYVCFHFYFKKCFVHAKAEMKRISP